MIFIKGQHLNLNQQNLINSYLDMKKERIDWIMFIVICIQFAIMIGLFVLYNIEVTNRDNYIKAKEYDINEHIEIIQKQQHTIEDLKIENQVLHDSVWHLQDNLNKK
jgi:amino acid permease